MTVAELIRILQTLDPTEEVRVSHPYKNETVPIYDVSIQGPQGGIPVIDGRFE